MRIRRAFLSIAVLAAVGLVVATAAKAADPVPPQNCTTSNGWSIVATGPTVGPCDLSGTGTGQCTQVLYNVTAGPSSTPDHVATFVRGEVNITDTLPVASTSSPCDGDSAIGMPSNVDCHENLIRWNNQQTKSNQFGVEGQGSRAPITTSVVVKKGNSVGSCAIVGLGLEGTNPLATTTPTLDEVLGGKCHVHVTTVRGETTPHIGPGCTSISGPFPVSSVSMNVNGQGEFPLEFSEGFNFIVGSGSCTWKQYYPTTGPIYKICY